VVELENVTLRNLHIEKDLDASKVPGLRGEVRVDIETSGPADGSTLLMKSSAISASDATFNRFTIDETNTSDPSTRFDVMTQDSVSLDGTEIRAHYLASESISVSDLVFTVCYDPDEDGAYEYGAC